MIGSVLSQADALTPYHHAARLQTHVNAGDAKAVAAGQIGGSVFKGVQVGSLHIALDTVIPGQHQQLCTEDRLREALHANFQAAHALRNPLLPSHVTGGLQVKTLAVCRKHYTGHFHLDLLTHVYFSMPVTCTA